MIAWDSVSQARVALRTLLAYKPCGPRCVIAHSVVLREGVYVQSQSYGPVPISFTAQQPDRHDKTGLSVIRGDPPRPRFARSREAELRALYPHDLGRAPTASILARSTGIQPAAAGAVAYRPTRRAARFTACGRNRLRPHTSATAGPQPRTGRYSRPRGSHRMNIHEAVASAREIADRSTDPADHRVKLALEAVEAAEQRAPVERIDTTGIPAPPIAAVIIEKPPVPGPEIPTGW